MSLCCSVPPLSSSAPGTSTCTWSVSIAAGGTPSDPSFSEPGSPMSASLGPNKEQPYIIEHMPARYLSLRKQEPMLLLYDTVTVHKTPMGVVNSKVIMSKSFPRTLRPPRTIRHSQPAFHGRRRGRGRGDDSDLHTRAAHPHPHPACRETRLVQHSESSLLVSITWTSVTVAM
jgi:hypothetical protein